MPGSVSYAMVASATLLVLLPSLMVVGAGGPDPFQLTVPVGHIGDEVEYEFVEEVTEVTEGVVTDFHNWTWRTGYRVDGVSTTLDAAGHQHRVLEWMQVMDSVFVERHPNERALQHVELESRAVIRADRLVDPVDGKMGFQSEFAPLFPSSAFLPQFWYNHTGLRFQGRTFALGDDLGAQQPPAQAKMWRSIGGGSYDWKETVAARGTVDGQEAIRVDHGRIIDAFGGRHVNRDSTWLGEKVPYPLYRNGTYEMTSPEGWAALKFTFHLVAFRPGTGQAIPWGADPPGWDHEILNEDAERSPAGSRHPAAGNGSTIPYGMDEALANVMGDRKLVAFAQWRRTHPDAVLAGTAYLRGAAQQHFWGPLLPEAPVGTWTFVWASPEGALFVVSAGKDLATGLTFNRERVGRLDVAVTEAGYSVAQALKDFPETPVTWSEVERLWKVVYPDHAEKVPTYAHWGFAHVGDAIDGAAIVGVWPNWAQELEIAWGEPQSSVMGQRAAPTSPAEASAFVVDARLGILILGHGVHDGRFLTLSPLESSTPRAHVTTTPEDLPPKPTAMLPAVGATVAALVVLAALLASVKWLSANAAALLAGYSRVQAHEVLTNAVRSQALEAIRADPGVTPPELARRLKSSFSGLVYHLRVLERHGLVSSLVQNRHKHYFARDLPAPDRNRAAVLRNERTRAIHDLVHQAPGISRAELANANGISLPALYWHTERLEQAALVAQRREGRRIRFFPATGGLVPTMSAAHASTAAQQAAAAPE